MLTFRPWIFLALLCSVVSASLVDSILKAFENAVDCGSCHALLVTLEGLAFFGDGVFVDVFTAVCKELKIQDADVCTGLIGQQGPIIANNMRKASMTGQQGTKLCSALLGLCQDPPVNPHTVQFPKATPPPKIFTSSGKPPFQVAHFSDVHIDREYTVGSEANCTKPICCRNYADKTGAIVQSAGLNGNEKCDSPVSLSDSMLRAITQFSPSNKFSIFTGDVVEAAIWLVTQAGVIGDMQSFNQDMLTKLGSPVYPAVGEYESAPVNSFPRNTTSTSFSAQFVFDTESHGWIQWIGAAAANQVIHVSGSYSTIAAGTNLRIISLNTVYWYKANFWLYDTDNAPSDPNGILAFLIQQLQAAEDAGQRAWVIGHMPPGGPDTLHDQSNYYDQIVQRYKNTIAAHFFGHSHIDEMEIAYSDYTHQTAANAVSVSYVGPALTPRSGNPAFKIYDVDPDTYEIMDSRVYISDLSDPSFQNNPTWKLYYSARKTYGSLVGLSPSQSLSPAFWHNVTNVFAANDAAFQLYNTFKTRGHNVAACDADCKSATICNMRAMRAENNCDVVTPGFHFKKRDDERSVRRDLQHTRECEGVGIGHIFLDLASLLSSNDSADTVALLREHLNEIIPRT